MSEFKYVTYNGMICKLYMSYLNPNDGPLVMITSPHDIEKAYAMGFNCIGYPDEIAKKVSKEEYVILSETGILRERREQV